MNTEKEYYASFFDNCIVFNTKGFELFKDEFFKPKDDKNVTRVFVEKELIEGKFIAITTNELDEDFGCPVNLKGRQPRINLGPRVIEKLNLVRGKYKVTPGDINDINGDYIMLIDVSTDFRVNK